MTRMQKPARSSVVYSTGTGRVRDVPVAPAPSGPPGDGIVRISRTKAGRGGKTVTLVTGLPRADVEDEAKALKRLCGSGGTVKDGAVEIQGDHRQRIADHLSDRYKVKLAGG
jgi:translation initiation factor 1